eukprot:5435503-Amphidinium_carterae.1
MGAWGAFMKKRLGSTTSKVPCKIVGRVDVVLQLQASLSWTGRGTIGPGRSFVAGQAMYIDFSL